MREFHDAVSTLLEAFARGIAVIKRKKERLPQDSTNKVAEKNLSRSLRKSRTDVKNAYSRDLGRFGSGFADGDAEAHSSLSSILFRLNAGFVSVIERFTRGKSTQTDYTALMNLSNASRMEAISTFEQLSKRLSRSSLALVPTSKYPDRRKHSSHKRKTKNSSPINGLKHGRSKSAPSLSVSSTGWVRPKSGRKLSSDSKASGSSTPKSSPRKSQRLARPPYVPSERAPVPHSRPDNRKSIMSFTSDSTKLGEIPEHKWARPAMFEDGNQNFPVRTYYPLEPYQPPEKQRSRFMRLFRR